MFDPTLLSVIAILFAIFLVLGLIVLAFTVHPMLGLVVLIVVLAVAWGFFVR